jgi:hypothetical protein
MADERRRAGKFETVGAWLHIWTPARDVEVPPIPWRHLLLFGVPLVALVTAGAWLVLEDASETKRQREAVEAREKMERKAAQLEQLRIDQALHVKHVPPADRPELVAELETALLADARARVRRGTLEQEIERVECEPFPDTAPRRAAELDPTRRSGRYYCIAVTSDIIGTGEGLLGYPFFARIRYEAARLAWCKINPIPGEQAVPDPRQVASLPSGCT